MVTQSMNSEEVLACVVSPEITILTPGWAMAMTMLRVWYAAVCDVWLSLCDTVHIYNNREIGVAPRGWN